MRYRLPVIKSGTIALDFEDARDRARGRTGLHFRIARVDGFHAIDRQIVVVDLGLERPNSDAPLPLRISFEWLCSLHEFAAQENLGGLRRNHAKRDFPVVRDFGLCPSES